MPRFPLRRAAYALLLSPALAVVLTACAPEVGSERWCEQLDATPKGEWSANDAAAYAKHCVLGIKPKAE